MAWSEIEPLASSPLTEAMTHLTVAVKRTATLSLSCASDAGRSSAATKTLDI